jgi:hypothetical protein
MTDSNRRPLKHRARERSFRFADYSKPQSKGPKDDRTLNRRGPQVEIVRPKWTGAAPLTFRPLPMFCAEDPSRFDPTHLTTDDYDFSDFMRGIPSVKYVGIDQKFTFLTYDPRRVYNENYNPRTDNPYHVLYNAIMDAVKKTGEAIVNGRDVMTGKWSPLVNDGPQKAFNAPSKMYFMQGAIFESDGDLYIRKNSPPKGLRNDDLPQIIELSKAAGDKIAKKLNMLNPEYRGDNDVEFQAEMYAYGDVVNLEHGMFFTLFNPAKHSNVVDMHEDFEEDDGNDSGYTSWGVGINPTFDYVDKRQPVSVSADISQYAEVVAQRLVAWDDVLYFPPDDEICLWMAQAFRSMPALLEFGWQDNPEFFTDEVRGVLANRVSVPGASSDEDEADEGEADAAPAPSQTKASAGPTRVRAASTPKVEVEITEADIDPVAEEYGDYEDDEVAITGAPPEVLYADEDLVEEDDELVEEDADIGDSDELGEEAFTSEEEERVLQALERSKNRAPTKVGPTGPPPRKPGFTEKPPVATAPSKARTVSKPIPTRKSK